MAATARPAASVISFAGASTPDVPKTALAGFSKALGFRWAPARLRRARPSWHGPR